MNDHCNFAILITVSMLLQKEVFGDEVSEECQKVNINDLDLFYRCCRLPDLKLTDEKKAIAQNCHRSVAGELPSPNPEDEEIYECFEECYFNASRWLTSDLKPNEAAIISEYDEELKSFPQWREHITKTIKTCAINDFYRPEAKCKSGSYQFSKCLGKNIFLNCPEDGWQGNDETCTSMKVIYEQCLIIF
ncbi:uncharacterized protein [Halyomorpha halys]|uniref:uncharacterized protein n=1 Tax=Halyomorpha halys TaxID=286706 RepID=UPI0006D4DE25|nr:uncharacterized protein LOC106689899 [Halyomorpha halys]